MMANCVEPTVSNQIKTNEIDEPKISFNTTPVPTLTRTTTFAPPTLSPTLAQQTEAFNKKVEEIQKEEEKKRSVRSVPQFKSCADFHKFCDSQTIDSADPRDIEPMDTN